ncbi:DMT family transporter [Dictyobacter kobayashii]|uniref:Permease n=1 Tax=Dictyobacter kobayashii TaxID=2014872 RepID=A0A402AEJ8_9CHLR|nr:DMT family transporter [Dictyobacter kobayashii]GCE17513.1 permease [Dictyobacter kobayashii]
MKAKSTASTTGQTEHPASAEESSVSTQRNGLLYVVVAVLFFATSPVFIRWSQPFHAVEIAFWRLAIAALLVVVLGLLTRQQMGIRRRELPRFLLYGLVTALHFFFYIASLNYTTTAHSLALTYTSPIFVTLLSTLFLRESLPLRKLLGMSIAVIGVAIMAGFEPHYTSCSLNGQCMVLGDGLALLSGLCYGIYSIIGRSERGRHPLFRYTAHVYGLAALWLLPVMLFFAFQHAYPLPAIAAICALGIFPLGLGHTLYNAALRKVHATYANLIATQEVTMGIILSVIFLHDIPSLSTVIGVLVTLGGIISVLL